MTRLELARIARSWLVAAGAPGGVPNPDRAVILADQDGTRPPMPYLTVRVQTFDVPIGVDERIVDDADPPRVHLRGQRYSTVSVNAYGELAGEWLERATLKLSSDSVLALTTAAGVAIQPQGGLNNLSGLRDTHNEVRLQRDFRCDYERITTEAELDEAVEVESVQLENTWSGDGPADLTETVTIPLP